MPLEILGPLVIFGISLTVLAVYFSGISKAARLTDAKEVQMEFLRDYADAIIEKTFLTSDNRAGFVALSEKNTFGLVEAMGSQFLTRFLAPGDVASVKLSDGQLDVCYNDFTHKKQHYTIDNQKDAAAILEALSALKTVKRVN